MCGASMLEWSRGHAPILDQGWTKQGPASTLRLGHPAILSWMAAFRAQRTNFLDLLLFAHSEHRHSHFTVGYLSVAQSNLLLIIPESRLMKSVPEKVARAAKTLFLLLAAVSE